MEGILCQCTVFIIQRIEHRQVHVAVGADHLIRKRKIDEQSIQIFTRQNKAVQFLIQAYLCHGMAAFHLSTDGSEGTHVAVNVQTASDAAHREKPCVHVCLNF